MMSAVVRRSRHSAKPVEMVMSAVVHRSRTCAYPVIVVAWSMVSNVAELMDLSWFERCGRDCCHRCGIDRASFGGSSGTPHVRKCPMGLKDRIPWCTSRVQMTAMALVGVTLVISIVAIDTVVSWSGLVVWLLVEGRFAREPLKHQVVMPDSGGRQ